MSSHSHAPFARVEDEALITGRGRYIADAPQPGTFEPVDNPATTEPLPATP